jgi:hypothetical protein
MRLAPLTGHSPWLYPGYAAAAGGLCEIAGRVARAPFTDTACSGIERPEAAKERE